jgi:replicative DNA helicase
MDVALIILGNLVYNEAYTRKVLPFLKTEYFDGMAMQLIFDCIKDHYYTYSSPPSVEVVAVDVARVKTITQPLAKEVESILNKLLEEKTYSIDWLVNTTEKFCKDRAVYLALVESIEITEGINTKKSVDSIADILTKALSVSFDDNVGINYIESAEERYDHFNTQDTDKIPFNLVKLDQITENGFARKTLNLVVGSTHTGKSQPLSEPVLTPNGWSTMGQLLPGDYVIGSDGNPTKVLAIHPQGILDVYVVETTDGAKIRCSADHLWSVYIDGCDRLITVNTKSLMDTFTPFKYKLPNFAGLQGGQNVPEAYVIGYCLVNSVIDEDFLLIDLYEYEDPDIMLNTVEQIHLILGDNNCIINNKLYYDISRISDRPNVNNILTKDYDYLNYTSWDFQSRLDFLCGILDNNSDKIFTVNGHLKFMDFNTSKINDASLKRLVEYIIRSLGGLVYQPKNNNIINFRLNPAPYKFSDKCLNVHENNNTKHTIIRSITKQDYKEKQVCITVDAPDKLYVTTGFKLTHNSMFLCSHAANCLTAGKNVLFITLEMSGESISQRIDANLMDTPITELYKGGKSNYLDRFKRIAAKTRGKLYIKEYPMSTAHAGHFKGLLDELMLKKQFSPDIIIVDYLNICGSSSGSSSSYERVKNIAEELRGLAQRVNLPIFSAIQFNRGAENNNDPDMSNLADSYAIGMVADFILALVTNESLSSLDQIMAIQIKNRYTGMGSNQKFVIGVDKSRMKFYDVEENYQINSEENVEVKLNKTTKKLSNFLTD